MAAQCTPAQKCQCIPIRSGLPGMPGRTGNPGRPGSSGQRGAPGPDGPHGAPGLLGVPGDRGEPGACGEEGIDGVPGLPGQDGPMGNPGAPGPCGAPGVSGALGGTGGTGSTGDTGPCGCRGDMGGTGPTGPTGATGDRVFALLRTSEDMAGGGTPVVVAAGGTTDVNFDATVDQEGFVPALPASPGVNTIALTQGQWLVTGFVTLSAGSPTGSEAIEIVETVSGLALVRIDASKPTIDAASTYFDLENATTLTFEARSIGNFAGTVDVEINVVLLSIQT